MTREFNSKAYGVPGTREELLRRLKMRAKPTMTLFPSPGGTIAASVAKQVNEANERRIAALQHVYNRDGAKLRTAFAAARLGPAAKAESGIEP
jgi:hypothetical protein